MTHMEVLQLALACAGIWSLFCRIAMMQTARTRLTVFLQHAALALGLGISVLCTLARWAARSYGTGAGGWVVELLATPGLGDAALAAGVVVFLLASAARWRDGAPSGTDKPAGARRSAAVAWVMAWARRLWAATAGRGRSGNPPASGAAAVERDSPPARPAP